MTVRPLGTLAIGCFSTRVLTLAIALLIALPFSAKAEIEIQEITTPSGIEAWLVEEETVPVISLAAMWRGGAAQDPEGKEGATVMLSSLLDQGAGDMDAGAFQTRLEDIAAELSFSAGKDSFSASLKTLPGAADSAFSMLGLALSQPRLAPEAVERVRRQMVTSYALGQDDPAQLASRAFSKAIYAGHPYGRLSDGTPESLDAIQIEDLQELAAKILAKDTLNIVIVGPVDAARAGTLIDEAFGALPANADLAPIPPAKAAQDETIVVDGNFPQSVARFGMQGLKRDDPDFIPAYVMNYVLGGGSFSSRLMDEVREKRGLAYSVWSGLASYEQGGLWIGQVATQNERFGESLQLIETEIGRMAQNGVTEDELKDAKTYLTGSYPLRFSSNQGIAALLVNVKFEDLGIDYVDKRNSLIEAVSQEDVARVAKRLLKPDNLVVSVAGQPVFETEDLKTETITP